MLELSLILYPDVASSGLSPSLSWQGDRKVTWTTVAWVGWDILSGLVHVNIGPFLGGLFAFLVMQPYFDLKPMIHMG